MGARRGRVEEAGTMGGTETVGCSLAPSLPDVPAVCGVRPAPTSASSATAPSLGRRARDPAGPDAACERAQQQFCRSRRAGGERRGLARGIVGKAWGRGEGQEAAGGVGRVGRVGPLRLTWPYVRLLRRLRVPLLARDREESRSAAHRHFAALLNR